MLLLIKNHLKGKIPTLLNAKDNKIFMDYLAGGHDKQISEERQANASSSGVLSVAARNQMAVRCGGESKSPSLPSQANSSSSGVLSVAARKQLAVRGGKGGGSSPSLLSQLTNERKDTYDIIKQASKDAHELMANLNKADENFASFMETRIMYAQKEHKQQGSIHKEQLKRKAEVEEQGMLFKRQALAFEVETKKKMIELRIEEAKAEEIYAKARQLASQVNNPGAPPAAAAPPAPAPPVKQPTAVIITTAEPQDIGIASDLPTTADVKYILYYANVPETLDDLDTFYTAVDKVSDAAKDAIKEHLDSLRNAAYEADLSGQLQHLLNENASMAQMAMSDSRSSYASSAAAGAERARHFPVHRPFQIKDSLKTCQKRIAHYCHLVFWALCRRILRQHEYDLLMGEDFKHDHSSGVRVNSKPRNSTHNLLWYSLDETTFGLPIDISNIPECVVDSGVIQSPEGQMLMANMHR